MVLKLGHFRKKIRNTWNVLKCIAGEGWRKSVGLIVQGRKEVGNVLRKRRRRKVIWTGHILSRNCLLQRVVEGKIERRI
jgi:hypothetical protein